MILDRRTGAGRLCRPGDIALLALTGSDLWRYEEALERFGIAVATQAGKGLFRRQEVQDLIALTRVLADRRDTLALGALLRGPLVGLTEEQLLDIIWALPRADDTPDKLPRLDLGVDPADIAHPLARATIEKLQALQRQCNSTTPHAREARALEIRLVNALKAGGESNGVIGRDAGANLQRLPSSVYWAGLGSWGIRLFPGSTDSLFTSMRHLQRSRPRVRESEDAASEREALQIWTPVLPQCPADLLDTAHFTLSLDEAQFVIDRLVAAQPHSLLAFLARNSDGQAGCDNIWEHPQLADFPAASRRLIDHAELFSSVMHGASLLYNLLLSRLRNRADWIDRYEKAATRSPEITPLVGWLVRWRRAMRRGRFTEDQIIGVLREHEAGVKTAELCRKHGIGDATGRPRLLASVAPAG